MKNNLLYDQIPNYYMGNEGSDVRFSGNFIPSSTPDVGLNIKINSDGTIRDDKLNIIRVELLHTTLSGDQKPYFEKTFLNDTENILREKISQNLPAIAGLDNGVYLFFCVKPQIGAFKTGLMADDLVQVQSAFKESCNAIVLKVNFKRALRPIYSLESEYKRKRNNSMILHVFLFYKKSLYDSSFTHITGINSFRFRSNSGRSIKPYTLSKKPKLESIQDDFNPNEQQIFPLDSIPGPVGNDQNYPPAVPNNYHQHNIVPSGLPHQNLPSFSEVESKPMVRRIHPDQCFAFENWDSDNPDITFILLGNNLTHVTGIKVYFVYKQRLVEALEKKTQFSEKEYFVPCVKRLFFDADITCLPENGLMVDVLLVGNNIETPPVQKFTYLNIVHSTQASFGLPYQSKTPHHILHQESIPLPPQIPKPSFFYFPDRCDESQVIRYYENNRLMVEVEDNSGRNILHYAIKLEFKELTGYAIQCGANINKADENGFTPLHMAVYYDNLPIVKLLLKHKASLKSVDSNGNNPYQLAVELKRYDIIKYILLKILAKCKNTLIKDKISSKQMSEVTACLKALDGKCTLYWRLQGLPYLPPAIRLICTAALIEKPIFVHFNKKTGMYSIKINHAKIIMKKLFPESRLFRSWAGSSKKDEEEEDVQDNDVDGDEISDEELPKKKITFESDDDEDVDLEMIEQQFMDVDLSNQKKSTNMQRSKSLTPDKTIL